MEELPDRLVCPIYQALPLDPVVAQDGHTYDRHYITEHLKTHATSPMTNNPMGAALCAPSLRRGTLATARSTTVVKTIIEWQTSYSYESICRCSSFVSG